MVRVPGSSGGMGYHCESQKDEVRRRQSAGMSSADRNEKEDLLEEKPEPPPYAFSEGTADHDVNRDPPGEEPKVKTEGTPPTTAPLTQKSLRKKKPKASRKKLKAPADSNSDSRDEIVVTWSDDQLEEAFNRNELQVFLVKNPVMKILQLRTPGSLKGPVTPPPATANKLDAVKAVLRLLKGVGITPGSFAGKDLFHMDLEAIQITLSELSSAAHFGSHRHDDLHCWKRLTCQRCGKRGHPSDRCLFVCRGCGEIHDAGKSHVKEFYNLIRQWYDPAKHEGVLPESAEKMLN
ncbi:hypothetical protein PPTG_21010 [Phytophthora nicotianae INRA-310]|uniref:CCHC-type domain-containing protein n=1 Tax=Phytophthora nicotianae (strain INRA-310) TaxID=761204 RepID=W2RFS6_PHYN3|nr:hypothetical protein PPTG_21010 [Phytophthora nicotianae INRA-310]ETN23380.1 hypothetical protein PPTG_21010 [Phytophthora nicotianae INRA-310]